ncbi:hypothetical protein PK35_12065 [Tamlana nanhaiensis]|uniref:DUF192 domain-containing protein n=1 Tax=Neotamlana nanhaiensis TaxID=1382798 RepID=A0A0D7VZX5_9FLAO|nr:DUF192 domain-containing protein [Tamlana nanhaiensis]KJD32162.1 hypothetical protein PK35_11180 [Tamlana nanhaiensis]KJD32324.1 hypothetical protein PK35_12065 [Tamlana nanhaiensis]
MTIKSYVSYFLLSLVIVFTSCKEDKKVIKQTEISFTKEGELTIFKSDSTQVKFDIEIAETKYETQTGLMYRNSMKANRGMLFIFNDVQPRSFYMKNTKIGLDLIFIDDNNKIVSFQKNAKPYNEASLPSNVPAKYVFEINAGLVDEKHILVGDSIDFIKQ